jgi:hypothetical protein
MAGEHVFHPFDRARFQSLLPLLNELDAARELSVGSRRQLAELFAVKPVPQLFETEFGTAARVLAAERLELRVHLRPTDLGALIEAVVLACIPAWGEFSFRDSVGSTWVVLDEVQRYLMDEDWYQAIISSISRTRYSTELPYPQKGETAWSEVSPRGIEALKDGVPRVLAHAPLELHHRAELLALRDLAQRVTGTTTLVFRCLL